MILEKLDFRKTAMSPQPEVARDELDKSASSLISPALQSLLTSEAQLIMKAVATEPAGSSLWLSAFDVPARGAAVRLALHGQDELRGMLCASASLWPTSDSAFSYVVLQHALDYALEPEELLAEAVRSLRGHGVLVICGFRSVSALRFSRSWRPKNRAHAPRFANASGWARTCKALGLADIRIVRLAPMWPWLRAYTDAHQSNWLATYMPNLCSAYVLIGRKRSMRASGIVNFAKVRRKLVLDTSQVPVTRDGSQR
jgi:SAM-dependent methyltransferase